MKIRVTVLMAIYNCSDTLEEALNSLINQTFKGFKIILCDDCSTDDTYMIAKKYAKKYNNIKLIRNKKNLKLAACLNKCLNFADTEYVARMDGDDISLPSRFEKQLNYLDNNQDYVIVSCPMIYFDESGDWGFGKCNLFPSFNDFKMGTPHPHAPSMMKTSVLKEVGGYTDSIKTVRVEDYYLWYKIYKAGYKGYNLQEHLYKMRDDQKAIKRRTFKARYNEFKIKSEVIKDLGFSFPILYTIPIIIKMFVPKLLMTIIRKKMIKIN